LSYHSAHAQFPTLGVSIRAPARGATFDVVGLIVLMASFQSAPLREGRLTVVGVAVSATGGFNPRPCARGDS